MKAVFGLMVIFSLFIVFSSVSDVFADTQNLSGSSHGNEISLKFSDGNVSGTITLEDYTINLSDVKVIERSDRLLIIDKQNDLKILSKQLSSDKYIILVKINSEDVQTKLRFVTSSEIIQKNTGQRNLFDAMEQKMQDEQKENLNSMTQRELQLQEKQKAIDNALKIHEERLARISEEEREKSDVGQTPKSAIEEYRKSQIGTGPGLLLQEEIEEEVEKIDEVVVSHIEIKTFLSIPHHQEWKKVLRFGVLVTDDSGHRYDSSYQKFIGNVLSDVEISGTINDPSNVLIHSFNGTTDRYGEYLGTFLIPDRITTNGEYTISVDTVKTFEDDAIATSSNMGTFFVFPSDSSGGSNDSNDAPVANAGPPQSEPEHDGGIPTFTIITLDGSASSDPDGDPITYSWVETTSSGVSLNSTTSKAVEFTAPNITVTENIIFDLTVMDDGGLTNTDSVTIEITFVD